MCALREAAGVCDPFPAASEEQVERMAALCDKALREGACGVSLGPAYTPGSSILEMQTLCRVAKAHGKPVSIDTRMNSMTDLDSLQERLKVIRGADVSGIACWRLDSEPEEVWPLIDAYMN